MRILIFQDHLRCGGTEKQSLFLADFFKREGHEVCLLTIRPGGVLEPEADIRGVRRVSLQPFDFRVDWLALGLKRQSLRFGPDIILCMGRVANAFGGYLQRVLPDSAVICSARTGKQLPTLNRRSFLRTRGVIVNAHWWKRELLDMGVSEERVAVVHNSCVLSLTEDRNSRAAFRAEHGVCSDTCVFLNVASLRSGKRHVWLIRAVAALSLDRPWLLWIVGAGPEEATCRALAQSLGIADRVKFWGYQEDPGRFYRAADVAVSASTEDSLPNFLVEAQSCGLPVIACDYRGVKECFRLGESGYLVDEEDLDGMTSGLLVMLNDCELRERFGVAGRQWARGAFAPDKQGRLCLDFFEKIFSMR